MTSRYAGRMNVGRKEGGLTAFAIAASWSLMPAELFGKREPGKPIPPPPEEGLAGPKGKLIVDRGKKVLLH